jgi:hypothetical protein
MYKQVQDLSGSYEFPGEIVKIPFKPSVWQKGLKTKTGTNMPEDLQMRLSVSGLSKAPEELHHSSSSAGFVEDDHSQPETEHTMPYFPQLAYGRVAYEAKAFSEYWDGLTLTECLMASPFFQHLSSEKFSALEHFAIQRTYKDQDVIVAQNQKFYNVYFIR